MGSLQFRAPAATDFAINVDRLFYVLLALTFFFSIVVGGLLTYLAIRYRRGSNVDRSRPVNHHDLLELTWSVGPLLMALVIFFWATYLYAGAYIAPPNAKEVYVIGKQWMWHLQHEDGIRENNELHIPVGEPVKLTMISQDVIHAFYVPEFRLQRQVEPGSYDSMWFTPTVTGKYHMYCNMYCGTQHSEMGGWVYVMSKTDYAKWVATNGGAHPTITGGIDTPHGGFSMVQQGSAYFEQYQCASCHSADAVKRGRGPNLEGIYGKNRQLTDGRRVKADFGYLRNVILNPIDYPLANWPQQAMPSYHGVLTEEQILDLNAYIRVLGTKGSIGNADGNVNDTVAPNTSGAPVYIRSEDTHNNGDPNVSAPAANVEDQQWRYMYGGEQ